MLAYLAMSPDRKRSRNELAGLFWSERDETHARASLRQALAALRKWLKLHDLDILQSDKEFISFTAGMIETDVVAFESLCASTDIADLANAARLYRGDFLQGLRLNEFMFEEWQSREQLRLEHLATDMLERLASRQLTDGDMLLALTTARRLLSIEPFRESGHRLAIRALIRAGRRKAAVDQYWVCERLLRENLGVTPDAETKRLLVESQAGRPRYENLRQRSEQTASDTFDGEPPALPDKPSVAVLPFDNLTGDPDQEYFADGMTEDIITNLSRFPSLFVIARNSTFSYKGDSPDARVVARDLGVRYVLKGSIRRGGERIRVTGQLIEAASGKHIWAERYDRNVKDIFALQDEVTSAIVAAIAPEIDAAERMLAQRKAPDNLNAWSRFQLGLTAYSMTTKEALEAAVKQFDQINALDPTFAPAFAYGARARIRLMRHFGWFETDLMDEARNKARMSVAIDPGNPDCLLALSSVYSEFNQHELAVAKAEEALSLNPNSAAANFYAGFSLSRAGRCDEAIKWLDRAIRLSPRDIIVGGYFGVKAVALFHIGRYQESVYWGRRSISSPNPRPIAYVYLIGALIKVGQSEEASEMLAELMLFRPEITSSEMRERIAHEYPRAEEAIETLFAALREAGLPE